MAEDSFDLDAAGLRADGTDVAAYIEVLARKLEQALPVETMVRRRPKRFLSRDTVVEAIEVTLGEYRYALHRHGGGVEASRAKEVRGIVIKREPIDLPTWVAALTAQLREQAEGSSRAREAFDDLMG